MAVVRAAEAPTFTLPRVRFVGLTAPSRGASEICTWRLYVEPHAPSAELTGWTMKRCLSCLKGCSISLSMMNR